MPSQIREYVHAVSRQLIFTAVLLGASSAWAGESDNAALYRAKVVAEIEDVAAGVDGVMGVAIKDLTSGEEITVNGDLTFPTGSSIKIPVLIELLRQAEEGRFSLSDQKAITLQDRVSSNVLVYFADGTSSLSLHDLAILMIRFSDNFATNLLIEQVGMDNVNRLLDGAGIDGMRLQRKMIDQASSAAGRENIATPRAAAQLMEALYTHKIASPAVCEQAIEILALPKGIGSPYAEALPNGVRIASKTGSIEGVHNEWAIVFAQNRPFAIAVAGNYLRASMPEDIGKVGRIAYDYFVRIGRSTMYGTRVRADLLPKAE